MTKNPPYHGGGDDAGTVFSWGFLSPKGRVIDGAKEEYHAVTTHDKLARSEGLGRSEAAALSKGYVRYLTSRFGTTGAKVEIGATIAEPWAGPAKVLWGYIERDLGGKSAGLMYLDFVEANGKQHYASIGLLGEERMKAVLMAVARGEDPANVTERERRRSAGREENPKLKRRRYEVQIFHHREWHFDSDWDSEAVARDRVSELKSQDCMVRLVDHKQKNPYFIGGVSHFGWINKKGKLVKASVHDQNHRDVAIRMGYGDDFNLDADAAEIALDDGCIRYFIEENNDLYMEIRNPDQETWKRVVAGLEVMPPVIQEVVVDATFKEGLVAMSLKDAIIKAKARVRTSKSQNPAHFADGIGSLSWGLISPEGRVHEARHLPDPSISSHDELAKTLHYRSAGDAIQHGYTRYAIYSTSGGRVRLIASAGKPWSMAARQLKEISADYPVNELILDLQDEHGARVRSIGGEGEAEVEAALRGLIRERNPLTLTPTHQRQARGNKFNILVEMTPMEFLRLTTVDDAQIAEIINTAKPLSTYNAAAAAETNIIPCFLTLDIASGKAKVTGHEGRHRAGALLNAGEEGVGQPVYLRIQDAHPGQAEKMLDKLPGGRKAWMWDTTYLWGWDELPEMLVGQFRATVKVPKSRLKVIEPYVQERAKKARGL